MRNLMATCAALALAAGIVAAILWRDLHAERQLNADLQARLGDLESRQSESAAAARPEPVATVASESKPATIKAAPTVNRAQAADLATMLNNQRDMLKDPEYRKARLAQTRLTLPQTYPGLVAALGLSPDEAGRLFDMLADYQLQMETASMPLLINGQVDQAAMQESMRARNEIQHAQDDAVLGLLGSSKFAQWQDYQSTRMSRMQATTLSQTLEAAGQPLTAAQMQPLTDAMIAEQKRQTQDMQAAIRDIGSGTADAQARFADENLRLQEEKNHRVLDAVASSLNARQLEILKATFDQQAVMSRASNRLARQQAALQAQSQGQ